MSELPISRRQLLKVLAAAAGTAALSTVPNKWKTPVVEVGALPAQAQLSGVGTVAGFVNQPPPDGPVQGGSKSPQAVCTDPGGFKAFGAVVSVDGFPLLTATTNQNGFYSISNVPAGSQHITAKFTGFSDIHTSATVPLGSTLCLNFGFGLICLSGDTVIDTPMGAVRVTDIRVGMPVWTLDATGLRIQTVVAQTVRRPVPPAASIVHLALADGREVFVSAGHPTTDGRTIGDLAIGDVLDGARVVAADTLPYDQPAKYDLLPAGETGSYWANGIPMNSTLEVAEKRPIPVHA